MSFETKKYFIINHMNFISYCDGKNSILEISILCKIDFEEAYGYYIKMKENGLV